MKFCTITPTRKDRPQFLAFCKYQLSRMETEPVHSYFIDYPPKDGSVDLIPRIKEGISQAARDGFNQVMIVEDDDFYPKTYFNNLIDSDFTGSQYTTYYNLKNKTYQEWHHPRRASLFVTGFKISALNTFEWPEDNERFLDLSIWNYAINQRKKSIHWRESQGAIGIKHGIGLCGGRGHTQFNKDRDFDHVWLKEHTDADAFDFYKSLQL